MGIPGGSGLRPKENIAGPRCLFKETGVALRLESGGHGSSATESELPHAEFSLPIDLFHDKKAQQKPAITWALFAWHERLLLEVAELKE